MQVHDILIEMIQGADMDKAMCNGDKCKPVKRETCRRYMSEPGTVQWYQTFDPKGCKAYIKWVGKKKRGKK